MITAAADGSSLSNPGPAGWAWYIDEQRWAAGGWPQGTNNMGELMAVLDLLGQTRAADDDLLVLCDSQYVINSLTKWLPGWKRKGWKRADGKPVQNRDLLEELDAELAGRKQAGHAVWFEWVKGHAGHELNERADTLARAAATAHRDDTPVRSGPGFGGPSGTASRPAASVPARSAAGAASPEPTLFDDPGPSASGAPAPEPFAADELLRLEKSLLDPALRADESRFRRLLHADFEEIGRSGRRYLRADLPGAGVATAIELIDPRVDRLGDGVGLVRYRTAQAGVTTWRASIWQHTPAGWRLRYHQGTDQA